MKPHISIIIVNYNSGTRLEKCLAHLAGQFFTDFETIVVDNASTDESIAAAQSAPVRVRLIEAGSNLGFAAANNLAVKSARGEWLAFLNPDAYAEPDWLAEFIAATEKYSGVEAFGSTQLNADNPSVIDGAGDVCHGLGLFYRGHVGFPVNALPGDGECFSPCAAAAFYKRDTFEKLGGFDEQFFCYGEDVDLGFRLHLSGGRAVQLAKVRVLHEGSGVTGRYSDFTIYHGVRNRLWVYRKNIPDPLFIVMGPVHMIVNAAMFVRAILAGAGSAYGRGFRDGVAGMRRMEITGRDARKKRKISIAEVFRLLTWSPLKLLGREADIRPIKNGP